MEQQVSAKLREPSGTSTSRQDFESNRRHGTAPASIDSQLREMEQRIEKKLAADMDQKIANQVKQQVDEVKKEMKKKAKEKALRFIKRLCRTPAFGKSLARCVNQNGQLDLDKFNQEAETGLDGLLSLARELKEEEGISDDELNAVLNEAFSIAIRKAENNLPARMPAETEATPPDNRPESSAGAGGGPSWAKILTVGGFGVVAVVGFIAGIIAIANPIGCVIVLSACAVKCIGVTGLVATAVGAAGVATSACLMK